MNMENNHSESKQVSVKERKIRVGRITRNFFLHFHSARVHPFSLTPTYTFGLGVILGMMMIIMIFTGVLLMMYYVPSVDKAYESVKDIIFMVPGGRIIRNLHRWTSYGMVIMVFLHLIRVFYTGSYLGNRNLNWVIGVVMWIIVLLMSFSGYLLPWDQLSYWAVTIGSSIAASARELTDLLGITDVFDVGGFTKKLFIGGENVGQPALTRFYTMHVFFLPLTLLILTGVHFWRIRKDGGLSRPLNIADGNKWYSWPVVVWTELALFLSVLAVLLFLAFFFDAPLLERANPSYPENPAKSPWYFLGIQEMVSYSAFAGGLLVPLLFLVFLFSIPYVDREDEFIGIWFSGRKGLRVTLYAALFGSLVIIIQLFVMVRFGWLKDWFPGISQWWTLFFNPATITSVLFIIYASFLKRRTRSSRMASIALFTMSMIGLVIFTLVGNLFRGPNWAFFWSAVQWQNI
ncbi:MAG: cytochrome b N-terminal domain-containing protein [Bacteroidales bacterium]|nr:cytochrome b N-terminal domain-containing protein [Bacteroidales bacterium]